MKKIIFSLMGIALLGLSMTSCNKEEELVNGNPVFTAALDGTNSKTHFESDGLTLKWDDITATDVEENIVVVEGRNVANYTASSISSNVATFTFASGNDLATSGTTYKVFYPTSAYVDATHIKLPPVQYYSSSSKIIGFPMYAQSNNTHLKFKNLCGVLKLDLTKSGKFVRTITITAEDGQALQGNFTLTMDGDVPSITQNGDHTNTNMVLLDCGESGVDISNGQDFYIYLPPATYSNHFEIEIMYTDYSATSKSITTGNSLVINRNNQYTITFGSNDLDDNITRGVFTVSNNPLKKVYFSSGNLLNEDGVWSFTKYQYERVTEYDADKWIHFGWSTPATNYGMNTSTSNSTYSGNFRDWSNAFASNPLNWHTLSIAEWNYLLGTRKDGKKRFYSWIRLTYNDPNGDIKYCNGMLILPDDWTQPAVSGQNLQRNTDSWQTISWNDWKIYEASGAAFLPCAGSRSGSDVTMTYSTGINNAGNGYYWSSSNYGTTQARRLYFNYSGSSVSYNTGNTANRYMGYCVRLVRPVETVTTSK